MRPQSWPPLLGKPLLITHLLLLLLLLLGDVNCLGSTTPAPEQSTSAPTFPDGFLPFGPAYSDFSVPRQDDGSSGLIQLSTDVVIFGSSRSSLYVNTNGVISFGSRFTTASSGSRNFSDVGTTPIIIAPFWDDVDVNNNGGTIYYRQEFDSLVRDQANQEINSTFPAEFPPFQASLVFIATWDRVQPFADHLRGLFNTFQAVIATDGSRSFVRFNYGDIQWGGTDTLIGVSAGDLTNYITHPFSLSPSITSLDNTSVTYRIDPLIGPVSPTSPPTCQLFDLTVTNQTVYTDQDSSTVYQHNVEVCLNGTYQSICDVGWDDKDAQLVCNFVGFAEPLYRGYAVSGLIPTSQIAVENVMCPSNTTTPADCSFVSPPVSPTCYGNFSAAGIRCVQVSGPTMGPTMGPTIGPTMGLVIPDGFLPFGFVFGDFAVFRQDDGSSEEIALGVDVVIFGSRQNRLYVNTNGVISFGSSFLSTSSGGSNFNGIGTTSIIAPFWDDININSGGTIYYRQESDPLIRDLVNQEINSVFPAEFPPFQASLVFIATWDRVAAFSSQFTGLFNTFQAVIASDGSRSFVRFNYGDIEWGGTNTLIGVSAGDLTNYITHPFSLSLSITSIDNTSVTYRIDPGVAVTTSPPVTPTTGGGNECFFNGDLITYFNSSFSGGFSEYYGEFEICLGGFYGSVCDIGWDQSAAEAVCRRQFGSNYAAEPLYGLGYPRRRYVAQNFSCYEFSFGLGSCDYNTTVDQECYNGPHVAGVRCTETCSDGDLRIQNETYDYSGATTVRGRVVVCVNGSYQPICDIGWDDSDAQIVCNERYGGNFRPYIGEALTPSFPLYPGEMYAFQDVMCNGSEGSLRYCSYNPPTSQCYAGDRSAGVVCRESCFDGEVRLRNNTYSNFNGLNSEFGVVLVCVNQQFVYVCSDGWDDREAEVACRTYRSDYQSPFYESRAVTFMTMSDLPIYHNAMCSGTEGSFSSCQLPTESPLLSCSSIGAVNCSEVLSQCYSEGQYRLGNANTTYLPDGSYVVAGRVEVCTNSTYSSVCDYGWDEADALVFCRNYFLNNFFGINSSNITATPVGGSRFGYTNGGIGVENVQCSGFESSLEGCSSTPFNSVTVSQCQDATTNTAGVICTSGVLGPVSPTSPPSCQQFDLIVTNQTVYTNQNSSTVYQHNVEVCIDGRYQSICDVGWDDEEAQLVCNAIGFAEPFYRGYAVSGLIPTSQIVVENVMCPSNTTSVADCSFVSPPVSPRCYGNFSAAGIRCVQVSGPTMGPVVIPDGFLPFGFVYGDSAVPRLDDGSSEEIALGVDVVIFGSRQNRLYVNTNGVISFRSTFLSTSSGGSNFNAIGTTPIVAPFWDDINVNAFVNDGTGGTIYYRQETDPLIRDLVNQEINSIFPAEFPPFQASLVFVATWDRVAAFSDQFIGLFNTFQAVIASDGSRSFVRFSYGDIQWGGTNTLIGVSAGDLTNYITHPFSLSPSITSIDNTSVTYRIDPGVPVTTGPPVTPTTGGGNECSYDGDLRTYFNYSFSGGFSEYYGEFEICLGGFYGSVCDIGWDQSAAEAVCRRQFSSNYAAEPLYGLGYPRRRYVAQNFSCYEFSYGLGSCDYNTTVDQECYDGPHVAGVRCTETCSDGDLRIQNETYDYSGATTVRGRVVVCVNGSYQPICDIGWDDSDAQIVCNERYGGSFRPYIGEALTPSFPLYPGEMYALQDVMCNGSEGSLRYCSYNSPTSQCYVGDRSAGVVCRESCFDGDVRLINNTYGYFNGLNSEFGVVLVCVNQQFVYVCSDGWDDREAEVACRTYRSDYRSPFYESRAVTFMTMSDLPIYHNAMCSGTEGSFSSCQLPTENPLLSCTSIGAVNCSEVLSQCYSEGQYQLGNANTTYLPDGSYVVTGRIEVCTNSTYSSVCDYGWGEADALVFCRNYFSNNFFGLNSSNITATPVGGSRFGYGNGGIGVEDVQCSGFESSLEGCSSTPFNRVTVSQCQDATTNTAGVICTAQVPPTFPPFACQDFDLRLTNQMTTTGQGFYIVYEGNVEVCLNGTYVAVCDVGWDDEEAQLVCDAMGYGQPFYRGFAVSGLTATSQVGVENVMCPMNATTAADCSFVSPAQSLQCIDGFSSGAGVRCVQERLPCFTDGEFSVVNVTYDDYLAVLSGREFTFSGRVVVCQNGVYSSVCDIDWDQNDADVFCNSGITGLQTSFAATPLYGLNSGPDPIVLESVSCVGNEMSVPSCSTSALGVVTNPICLQSNRAAGVTCRQVPGSCIDGQVRLIGGQTFVEGRLEVCMGGQWLSVCDSRFNNSIASTICTNNLLLNGGGEAVAGGFYGQGTGPLLSACPSEFGSFIGFVPVANGSCSTVSLDQSCTHERDVGLRCSPGQLTVFAFPTAISSYGSSGFSVDCRAQQFPWQATRLSSGFYDVYGNPVAASTRGGPASIDILQDVYNSDSFNLTYTFFSRLNFDHPLTVSDGGNYSCNVSVELTYPDNSTAVLTNSSFFTVFILAPQPEISIMTVGSEEVGSQFEGYCLVYLPSPELANYTAIQWFDSFGNVIGDEPGRVRLLPVSRLNETHLVRGVIIESLELSDRGYYTCIANTSGEFLNSPPAQEVVFLDVSGSPTVTTPGLFCYEYQLRLTNETYTTINSTQVYQGNAEICLNGTFVAICDLGWDDVEAQLVCNSLGFTEPFFRGTALNGLIPTAPIGVEKVMCSPNATSAAECPSVSPPISSLCSGQSNVAAGVRCTAQGTVPPTFPPFACQDFDLRLTNQMTTTGQGFYIVYEGNVEVCLNGTYVAVCDVGWDDEEAQLVCDAMGYGQPFYRGFAVSGLTATSQVGVENVMCPMNATTAADCSFVSPAQSLQCIDGFSSGAGVRCVQERSQCFNDGEFSVVNVTYDDYLAVLSGREFTFSGRVVVCQNGVYSSVCDIDWDQNDADVFCNSGITGLQASFAATPLYGLNSGPDPIVLESVSCVGNETSVPSCPTSPLGVVTNPICLQSNRAAGVTCRQVPGFCIDGQVRLIGGQTFIEGRLEVCMGGQWLSVCDSGFDNSIASSICSSNLLLNGGGEAVTGSFYGQGTGPLLSACPSEFGPFVGFVPVANGSCSTVSLDQSCTHERDVGLRCSPGQLTVFAFPTAISSYGSSGFSVDCRAQQFPWQATRLSSGFYDVYGNPVAASTRGGPASIDILQDVYNSDSFNLTYTFFSRLNFDHPLTVSDGGNYSCNVSVELTYPDNSTAVLTNSSFFTVFILAPQPEISIMTVGSQEVGSQFEGYCLVYLPSPELANYTAIQWFDSFGNVIGDEPGRVRLLPVSRLNETHLVRGVIIESLELSDRGYYTCIANTSGEFLNSPPAQEAVFLDVSGSPTVTTPGLFCYEYQLRLTNETYTTINFTQVYQGNAEICLNGTFVAICDLGWDDVEAQLVCSSLGFTEPFFRGTALSGLIPTAPIGVEKVMCSPNATSAAECPAVSPPISSLCSGQSNVAAGVRCTQVREPACSTGQFRIGDAVASMGQDGTSGMISGRVEVCYNSIYGSVCDLNWDESDARVLCTEYIISQFGIDQDSLVEARAIGGSSYGYSPSGIVLENITCSGFESSPSVCSFSPLGVITTARCRNPTTSAAGVECIVQQGTRPPSSGNDSFLLPFGTDLGDQTLPLEDDISSPEIRLNTTFVFYGSNYTRLYVSENGILSFDSSFTSFQPSPFPFPSPPLIAPFWADFDLRRGGDVYYRQTSDPEILNEISASVSPVSGFQFAPTLAFIATWANVPAFDGRLQGRTNTFQVVLATNGTHSFVAFIYGDIQWTTDDAQIGFYAGDGGGFFSLLSTNDAQGDGVNSNVDARGVFVYRTDNRMSSGPVTTDMPTPPPFCTEGSISTVSSNFSINRTIYGTMQRMSEFRFEVCTGNRYASICDIGWDDNDAAVVCRNLGFFNDEAIALTGLAFSRQEEIYGIQGVMCNGTEYGLEECTYNTNVDVDACTNGSHVAAVRCIEFPRPCYVGDTMTTDVNYTNVMVNGELLNVVEGTFEHCINGFQGPVCDIGWDDVDASVLCRRMQGDDYFGEALLGVGYSDRYIAQDIVCNGTEYGLDMCSYSNATDSCNGQHVAGFRCTQIFRPCSSGDFRTSNETSIYDQSNGFEVEVFSARIEVCVNGSYVALCDTGFNRFAAEVACGSFGNYQPPYFRAEVLRGAFTDFYTGPVYSGDINCTSEYQMYMYSLSSCRLTPGNDATCADDPSRAVGFRCVRELIQCYSSDGQDFRLSGGRTEYFIDSGFRAEGRPEICYNQTYGSICSQGWDDRDATAFCRHQFGRGTMGVATNGSQYGISPVGIVVSDIKCSGRAGESISDCSYGDFGSFVGTSAGCDGQAYVAGVVCSRQCDDGITRLVGGAFYEGRVEVCVNNQWGGICDVGWDDVDAAVVCRSIQFYEGGAAGRRGDFGESSVPLLVANVECMGTGREYTVSDCRNSTNIPPECSPSTAATVSCAPGLIEMEIVSTGVPRLGSSGFSLQCNAAQYPWNSQLLRYRWNSTAGGELTSNNRRNISLLNATYDPNYSTFVFNSSIRFDPLTFQDAGEISCGLALNLTYPDGPDNSSAVVMNRTTYSITLDVPRPDVTITSVNSPVNDQPYTATCMVRFVAAVPMDLVNIEWMDEQGSPLTELNSRVSTSPIRRINGSTYARDVIVSPIRIEDGGTYICEAGVMGAFVTSEAASESYDVVVFAQTLVDVDQEIHTVVLDSPTSVGDDVTFVCSVFASPVLPAVEWQYIGPDGTTAVPLPDTITPVVTMINSTNLTSTITIQNVQFSHRGEYRCSTGPDVYDSARLVVAVLPQLSIIISSINNDSTILTEEDSFTLGCVAADHYPPASITWFKNTNALSATSRIRIIDSSPRRLNNGLYRRGSAVSIAGALTSDSGAYYCKATLQVEGRDQPLTVRVDGNISVLVQARNECIISTSPNVETPCQNGYCVDSVGDYFCVCSDGFQGRNCDEMVTVDIAPTIILPPTSKSYRLGDLANITCVASGQPAPTYQWFFNNLPIAGEISPFLIRTAIAPEDRGVYYCTATNRVRSVTSAGAQITLEGVQQYSLGLGATRRRKRQTDSIQMFIDGLSGTPVGDTGITIYSAAYQMGPPESVLATLNAGESGQFPETGLTDSLQAAANGVASQFGVQVTGVRRFDGCPSEPGANGFIWPEADLNLLEPVRVSCNCGDLDTTVVALEAVRNCSGSYEDGASWADAGNSSACQLSASAQSLCVSSTGTTEEAVASVLALTQDSGEVDPSSVTIAITLLSQNSSALESDEVRENVINSLGNLLSVDRMVLQESQSDTTVTNLIIDLVDSIADSFDLVGQQPATFTADNGGLSVGAIAPDVNDFPGVSYDVNFDPDGSIQTATPVLAASSNAETSISIPSSIFNELGLDAATLADVRFGFSVFQDDSFFQPPKEAGSGTSSSGTFTRSTAIGSSVISAVLSSKVAGQIPVKDLSMTIAIELSAKKFSDIPDFAGLKEEDYNVEQICVFWDQALNDGYGNWSSEGCRMTTVDGKAVCECTHLTSFALLMDVTPKPTDMFALAVITYIGLAISIIALLLTIITYIVVRKLRLSDVGKMLLNLCFALLGLYVAFLISTSAERLSETAEGRNACGFFSALLHYFMLAYFFWTAAEAVFLFMKLVVVSRGDLNKYVYIAMLVCWGVPVVIVAISLAGYQFFLSETFCRPTQWPFYFGFVVPFGLIYVFNWVMFAIIMVALCMHAHKAAATKDTNVKSMVAKHLIVAVILSLLFGLGWAFGLIGTSSLPEEVHIPAQYIFSIFVGIQGLLIFLLHAVRSPKARDEWRKWWYIATCRRSAYYLKRRVSYTVTNKTSSRRGLSTLEGSSTYTERNSAFEEGETVPLSAKRDEEMTMSTDTSTAVENVYVIDPTDEKEPEKVDLSNDADESKDETSKL